MIFKKFRAKTDSTPAAPVWGAWSIVPPVWRKRRRRRKNAVLRLFIYNIFCAHDTMLFFYYFLYFIHFQYIAHIFALQRFNNQHFNIFSNLCTLLQCPKVPIFAVVLLFCTVIFAHCQKILLFYFAVFQHITTH